MGCTYGHNLDERVDEHRIADTGPSIDQEGPARKNVVGHLGGEVGGPWTVNDGRPEDDSFQSLVLGQLSQLFFCQSLLDVIVK